MSAINSGFDFESDLNFDSFFEESNASSSILNNNVKSHISPQSVSSEEVDVLNVANTIQLSNDFKTFDMNTFTQQLQAQFIVNPAAQFTPAAAFDMSMFEQYFKQYPAAADQVQQQQQLHQVQQQQQQQPSPQAVVAEAPSSDKKKNSPRRSKSASPQNSPASASSPSSIGGESNGEQDQKPVDEKEAKRQRRLIKNRESAQASRERKKSYMQGLEKKVNDLSSHNTSLANRLLLLEEENFRLREQLKRGNNNEIFQGEEPDAKRIRRGAAPALSGIPIVAKIPLPRNPSASAAQQQLSLNPMSAQFWQRIMATFGGATPVAPAAILAAPVAQQEGQQQQQQQQEQASAWAQLPAKGIVLFIMLFCLAFLIGSNSTVNKYSNSEFAANNFETKRAGGRKILEVAHDYLSQQQQLNGKGNSVNNGVHVKMSQQEFANKLKQLYEQFNEIEFAEQASAIKVAAEAKEEVVVADSKKAVFNQTVEQDGSLNFHVHVDKQQNNLVLTIPVPQQQEATGESQVVTITKQMLENMCQYLK